MKVDINPEFHFEDVVWAIRLAETEEYDYEIVGPDSIDWIESNIREETPGKYLVEVTGYGLKHFHKPDGWYPDELFRSRTEAAEALLKIRRCLKCPDEADCQTCIYNNEV